MTSTRDSPAVGGPDFIAILIVVLHRAQLQVRRRSKSHFSATSSPDKCLNFGTAWEFPSTVYFLNIICQGYKIALFFYF